MCVAFAHAQAPEFASWSGRLEQTDARAGEAARILITGKMKPGWHIYKMFQTGGPIATTITVPKPIGFTVDGDPQQPEPSEKFDKGFKIRIGYFEGEATFAVPIKISADAKGKINTTVDVRWQACDKSGCANPTTTHVPLSFVVAPGAARVDRQAKITTEIPQTAGYLKPTKEPESNASGPAVADEFAQRVKNAESQGLLSYLWLAFSMGLLALLTPCVFPMVPVTVSFFSKRSESGNSRNVGGALAYCLGIIATFTALGLAVTLTFGATGLQALSANPWVNFAMALLFVVLALSLFGVLQFRLPQGLVGKAQSQSRGNGFIAPLMMGLTFSMTSFTCTVPFVGTLLAGAAAGKGVLYPTFGMMAFSLALSLPFFLLAMFPSYLQRLPRAGAWMSVMKTYMGFLELAFALKFLSNMDLALSFGALTKPVFLGVWGLIFALGGLYLLGWVVLPNDGGGKPGIFRRLVGVATLAASVYSFALINSAPAPPQLLAFLPPTVYPGSRPAAGELQWLEDVEAAKSVAKTQGKLLLLNFTGVTCTNCRQMEQGVFPQTAVRERLDRYVLVELYTDRDRESDRKNLKLRDELTKSATNPVYVVLRPDGSVVKTLQPVALSAEEFLNFLNDAETLTASR